MTTNDSKSGLGYLNKLVDEYNIFFLFYWEITYSRSLFCFDGRNRINS